MSKNRSVAGVIAGCVLLLCSATPAGAGSVILSPPTGALILDSFRLPDGPYGAGNRGIEYDTLDGDLVHAAAGGVVAFAGPVGGSLFVSVDHSGDLRTTYGFVRQIVVRKGTEVARGELVAVAGGPFHFTVRLDGDYVDPALFFGSSETRLRLVASQPGDRSATAGLWNPPDTLLDGSFGPRMLPYRERRNHWVRATPGRLGVPHEHETGKEGNHGSHLHEAAVGSRRPLRPPDSSVEPEDEAVHPR